MASCSFNSLAVLHEVTALRASGVLTAATLWHNPKTDLYRCCVCKLTFTDSRKQFYRLACSLVKMAKTPILLLVHLASLYFTFLTVPMQYQIQYSDNRLPCSNSPGTLAQASPTLLSTALSLPYEKAQSSCLMRPVGEYAHNALRLLSFNLKMNDIFS